ncbi:hypothetical protein P879_11769 [Paragonimus westermani]|uniref:Uncharacterized protein n=1 Tax=Paragonimus westermani TaxID=34504 RepID=A0A8T0D9K4_9TREM|nr:hypothetical protein P879_11769 [Paragonimus westermani]
MLDQLAGKAHEIEQSLTVIESRVRIACRRACAMIQSLRHDKPLSVSQPSSANSSFADLDRVDSSDRTVTDFDSFFSRNQVLMTLDELQNLVESVCAVQLRCGVFRSCDKLSCDHLAGFANLHTVTPNPGSLTDLVCPGRDHKLSPSLSLLFSVLRTLNQRTLTLKQRLRVAIRRLERSAVSSPLDFAHSQESPYAPNSSAHGSSVLVDQLSTRLDKGYERDRITPDYLEKCGNGNIMVNPLRSSLNSVRENLCSSACTSQLRTVWLPLFVFLVFTCLCLVFRVFGRSRNNWLSASRPLFCRFRPGFTLAELSLNWWLRQIACLHLPDSREIPF